VLSVKFGVLLPHYGEHCTSSRLIDGSQRLEELGFDSVWVRDHLLWKPHGMEGSDPTFLDGLGTLACVAGATRRIELGTAVVIPIRWPLKVAQDFATLSFLGGRPVHAGFGMGSNSAELGAAGFDVKDREGIFTETIGICKQVWSQDNVTWEGELFRFANVSLSPKPSASLDTWYGGTTRASVRRAVAHCDGWLPGRLPLATLDDRLGLLRELAAETGRPVRWGAIPIVCVDEDRKRALDRVDVPALAGSSEGSARWIKPRSGEFRTPEDLEGLLVAGDPADVVQGIRKFEARGIDQFVFDLRLDFDRYEDKLELIAQHVLPSFR
jgi:alkanesulfonate monooxygenase SsuD/methylene tetrahydromethanopterin reductase-like flavin-dependent oxidoreductase (luciferase family)